MTKRKKNKPEEVVRYRRFKYYFSAFCFALLLILIGLGGMALQTYRRYGSACLAECWKQMRLF